MEIIQLLIQVIAGITGCLAALLSIPLFFSFRWPAAALWGIKLYTSALSPILALLGLLTSITGFLTGSIFLIVIGLYDLIIFLFHLFLVTRPPASRGNFVQAFGLHWKERLLPRHLDNFIPTRTVLKLPEVAESRLQQDVCFAIIPGTDRKLLCDLWLSPENKVPSGLAFIYLHGSAFYLLDKDYGTRTLFRYLAAQGHLVMDVAYRLAPETDILGMIQDAKRAIHYLKENAGTYKLDPSLIVAGGASAGGYLALMAAYTARDPVFNPIDLDGKDLSVKAVVSLYGPTDLEALYYHTNQHLTTREIPGRRKKQVPTRMPAWLKKRIGKDYHRLGMDKGFEKVGTLAPLLGGHPDECPERYRLFSTLSHVHTQCPPTLLIHGEHDIMSPVKTTRILHGLLREKNVPSVLHIFPQTEHAFDLVLPNISPAAHNVYYDLERFLALMATGE